MAATMTMPLPTPLCAKDEAYLAVCEAVSQMSSCIPLHAKDMMSSSQQQPVTLPGDDTPSKHLLAQRLTMLSSGIKALIDDNKFHAESLSGSGQNMPIKLRDQINSSSSSIIDEWLASKGADIISPADQSAMTTDDSISIDDGNSRSDLLSALYSKVKLQQQEIESQRKTVASLETDLSQARNLVDAFTDAIQPDGKRIVDTDLLDRELTKSQNANRAFQKALREIGEVVIAVAQGDLSKKVTLHAREMDPEIVKFKETINTMMDQLQRFASEVTRVATEVAGGTLGGQAEGDGTVGVWRELTDNVNVMASNLTNQVREIADVTRAVAKGDLSRKINVHAQGEILELQKTINSMVDQLRTFAFEVTRVSRETGVEGQLGGQAQIEDVEGIWKELTDNGKYLLYISVPDLLEL